jgi:hypothetical protein
MAILVYFVAFWYVFPILVCCTKKNLATLAPNSRRNSKFAVFLKRQLRWSETAEKRNDALNFVNVAHFLSGVARWHIFKKIPVWVNFGGTCSGRLGHNSWPFGLFRAIGYILWPFGIFYGHLVHFFVLVFL